MQQLEQTRRSAQVALSQGGGVSLQDTPTLQGGGLYREVESRDAPYMVKRSALNRDILYTSLYIVRALMQPAHHVHACCTPCACMLYTMCMHVVHHVHACCTPCACMLYTMCMHAAVHHVHACCTPCACMLYTMCMHVVHHVHACCTPCACMLLYTMCMHVVHHVHACCTPCACMLLYTMCMHVTDNQSLNGL